MQEITEVVTGEEARRRYVELGLNKIPLPKKQCMLPSKKVYAWGFKEGWKKRLHPCLCDNGVEKGGCPSAAVYISIFPQDKKRIGWKNYTTALILYRAPKLFLAIQVTLSYNRFLPYALRIEKLDIMERTFGRDSLIAPSSGCPSE